MSIGSWLFVICGFGFVLYMAHYCRRYIRDAVDFFAAGRVAGRYVLSVASLESALGLMALIGMVEMRYKAGLSLEFWNVFMLPLGMFLSLTGFCIYRYRQTRSLSFGEFLERRYNRPLRIFSMILRTTAEMLTNTIGPAIAARVFIYLFGWPTKLYLFGFTIDTFMLIMAVTLFLAWFIISCGGMLALLVTDSLQALLCYPIFVIFTIYVFSCFSWSREIVPALADRVPGESFLNPFDIEHLKEFNAFAIFVIAFGMIMKRAIWYGGGQTGSARTPHEQKMAGVLGELRNGFSSIMTLLFALLVLVIFSHPHFFSQAHEIRQDLAVSVVKDIVDDPQQITKLNAAISTLPEKPEVIEKLSIKNDYDQPYMKKVQGVLTAERGEHSGNAKFQEFRTLFYQMMFPVTMRHILPDWLMAVLCLLLIMLMVSTDDSKMFSSSLTITQDIIVPLRKKPMEIKTQLTVTRVVTALVAIFFFFGSLYLSQLDYIKLYIEIMTSIWAGGAGPVAIFGLYSRFGNSWGAFSSLIMGSSTALFGIFVQRKWASVVYPFLVDHECVESVRAFLAKVSSPLYPYVNWQEISAVKCPISSYEFSFIAMLIGILSYVVMSLLTNHGKRFDLDKLLHRDEEVKIEKPVQSTWQKISAVIVKIAGVTPEYTRGDKFIAWGVFCYSIVWRCGLAFLGVVIWNLFSKWSLPAWSRYFFVTLFLIPGTLGVFTTVWFLIGGIRDLRQLFRDLAKRKADFNDNGFVVKK